MDFYIFSIVVLIGLAVCDLVVGVVNDAVNFLNSSIGSKVAPRNVIMIIASLGILAGVTFSSGMMEVARKGIFHPRFFVMPELITIFLAVMLTDIILLDLFNTFGLPTSTTVSIVFELLGAAVAVSLIKIYTAGNSFSTLVDYINTGKALAIISGILLSIVIAFFSGAIVQFVARIIFTFDYRRRLKRFGGVWGGLSLAVITYFILIKGAKGTSFLTPESVAWIKTHTWTILLIGFGFFGVIFQLLAGYTKINILKPIVLIGTFALAMAFAGNDLVNFIGVPLAGLNAYNIASAASDPLSLPMEALQKPIQSNTFLLLIAGAIMVITLWISKKSRTVSKTELSLGRQEEGMERFGSSVLSRNIVRNSHTAFSFATRFLPVSLRKRIFHRLDSGACRLSPSIDGTAPSFDLLRASVNLFVASAVVSFATSLKLPLSTTYVTFMVAMGTSLSDQAWGRESAVYRVAGVLTVISGWFLTALVAFTVSFIFAFSVYYLKLPAIIILLILLISLVFHSYRLHFRRQEESSVMESFSLKNISDANTAVNASFEQTGQFLKEVGDSLGLCFDAAFSEDRQRLRDASTWTDKVQKWANIIIANTFETLFLLRYYAVDSTQKYAKTIRFMQGIAESHRDIIKRSYVHFENCHEGFSDLQKEELRRVKTYLTRLLWNTSIMLRQRKKVDYDYIANQSRKLEALISEFDKNQIKRIQGAESKMRLSILYYAMMENSLKIAEQTQSLLNIFKDSFKIK
ncbi:MAG: inorganic phosphate transporter [Desulfobacterales bacterium]|nr:inorganic phosphate transporter [Desulfobacterales bacterium]